MYIQCKHCNHCEKTDKKFFVRLIGAATAGMGYWAWVAYFFAGTGFAMPICIAIMAGGAAMLAYADTIIPWISKRYDCPKCKNSQWIAIDDETAQKVQQLNKEKEQATEEARLAQERAQMLDKENVKYKSEIEALSDELNQRKNELQESIKTLIQMIKANGKHVQENEYDGNKDAYIKRLEDDIDFLMEELENKESTILKLNQNQQEKLAAMTISYIKQERKVIERIQARFNKPYTKITINDRSYKYLARINENELLKFEQKIQELNNGRTDFRDNIYGADVKEMDFNQSGRIYIRKIDNNYNVVCVGNKNTQAKDIEWLKRNYPK